MTLGRHCSFVPPYLLERIAASESAAAEHCRSTLATDQAFRAGREAAPTTPTAATGAAWVVHTAANGATLPGRVVRTAGDAASGDTSVDEAADGITATLALYRDAYARASYDGKGAEVVLTVHYQQNYDNAFWNGTQLVFGDGDGTVFGSFTKPVDVLGHEFTHAVTQFTADLAYQGQSGALNEAVSDISVVAKAIGISEADLQTALDGGQTVAAVAKAHNVAVQTVIDALVADGQSELAADVTAGRLTQAQADAQKAQVTQRATDQVNGTLLGGPMGGGPGGFSH